MNKEELIKKYKAELKDRNPFSENVSHSLMVSLFLDDLNQLDEPQKPVVPQFVADWIKYCKSTNVNLQHALLIGDVYFYNYANQKDFSKLKEFLETENNQEIFARAWLDGYTVEKEKRYRVRVKNTLTRQGTLNRNKRSKNFIFSNPEENSLYDTKFTRRELEQAGFGWVFDCPGIEIEEVE